ncbi:MAG TPA: DNA-3-methyladenine glycosylase [Gemmatimonadaceae bacterium]|nr:DNA-3-methyladenine glycosylase [Gemmatimonadaceae bacterium]
MKKPRPYTPGLHRAAVRHLKRSDPVLAALLARVGPYRVALRTDGTHFDALARSIVSQQLSVKAAATIHGRFRDLLDAAGGKPRSVATIPDARLRAAGLSRQKISYIKDLARAVSSGELSLDEIDAMTDEELIARLTAVKGIGRWTAQMFLMFRLGRPDVLPTLDLGIQNAIQRTYGLRKRPSERKMEQLGRAWAPYRTVACWYLWRSLDQPAVVKPRPARARTKRCAARVD